MVPAEGFEPPTFGLQNRCTTTVLSRPLLLMGAPLLQMMPKVQPSVRASSGVRPGGLNAIA